jgi:hypothetical protein
MIVPEGVFGEEQTSRTSPRAFSEKIFSNSKKNKTTTNRLMGWIENGLNKFLNQNFVCQTFPQNQQLLLLDFNQSCWKISFLSLPPLH